MDGPRLHLQSTRLCADLQYLVGVRKIIHLDMDCFYAAVEMRERPELAGMPVAVGGGSRRGVVTTCNYEARKFGIHSAMPGFQARDKCPQLIFLPVRFDLYRAESARIRDILLSYTPLLEPLSLDEAYLDVTALNRYAWDIAKEIRQRIFDETRLTGSAGIAPNKMLAKIASDWRKPNGQFAITPEQIDTSSAICRCARSGASGRRARRSSRRKASAPAAICRSWICPNWCAVTASGDASFTCFAAGRMSARSSQTASAKA